MGKFLLGLLSGVVLMVVIAVLAVYAVASFRTKPPSVADGSTLILHLNGDAPEAPPVDTSLPFLESRTPMTVESLWSRKADTCPIARWVCGTAQRPGASRARTRRKKAP